MVLPPGEHKGKILHSSDGRFALPKCSSSYYCFSVAKKRRKFVTQRQI